MGLVAHLIGQGRAADGTRLARNVKKWRDLWTTLATMLRSASPCQRQIADEETRFVII